MMNVCMYMHAYVCILCVLWLSRVAIGELVKCPLSLSSRQTLARKAVFGGRGDSIQGNSLLGYLKSEVHVGTACVGVGVLVRWCGVMGEGDQVPSSLVEYLKVCVRERELVL